MSQRYRSPINLPTDCQGLLAALPETLAAELVTRVETRYIDRPHRVWMRVGPAGFSNEATLIRYARASLIQSGITRFAKGSSGRSDHLPGHLHGRSFSP